MRRYASVMLLGCSVLVVGGTNMPASAQSQYGAGAKPFYGAWEHNPANGRHHCCLWFGANKCHYCVWDQKYPTKLYYYSPYSKVYYGCYDTAVNGYCYLQPGHYKNTLHAIANCCDLSCPGPKTKYPDWTGEDLIKDVDGTANNTGNGGNPEGENPDGENPEGENPEGEDGTADTTIRSTVKGGANRKTTVGNVNGKATISNNVVRNLNGNSNTIRNNANGNKGNSNTSRIVTSGKKLLPPGPPPVR